MKTIWEKGEDDGSSGRWRTSETNIRVGGGGENGSMLEGTKSMRIVQEEECNSSSSSSIGDDSDGDREEDVESRYGNDHPSNNGSFDDAIQALEEALPIRRGISAFYNGKSKSFTSLTDADVWPSSTTSSIQDIAKPENVYTRKRRNLGAFKLSNINTGRKSKKPKTTTLHFTLDRDNPNFTKQSQINRPLQLRSFSMVNLHRYNSTKIGNC